MKGINDDVDTFRGLHQKLLRTRIRPYYVFYCEPAPGIDHLRTPVEKGAELSVMHYVVIPRVWHNLCTCWLPTLVKYH